MSKLKNQPQSLLHAQVYALAEKYDVAALKHIARHKFECTLAYNCDGPDLIEMIRFVYRSTIDTDRGLRDVVVKLVEQNPPLFETRDIQDAIRCIPNFAADLGRLGAPTD